MEAKQLFARQIDEYDSGRHRLDPSIYETDIKDFFGTKFESGDYILVMEIRDLNGQWLRAGFNLKSEEQLWNSFEFMEMFGNTPKFVLKQEK